jgi:hypothetical protein
VGGGGENVEAEGAVGVMGDFDGERISAVFERMR